MGKVCKKSWIAAIFLGVMLFAAGFAFQASTVDAQAATTGFRTVKGKTYYYKIALKVSNQTFRAISASYQSNLYTSVPANKKHPTP